jgi:hypothetical protein
MFVGSSDERMKKLGCPPYFPNRKLKGLLHMQERFQAGAEYVCARGSRESALTSLAKLIVAKMLFFSCYRSARMLATYA